MNKVKSKYLQDLIRLYLIRAVLFFSVFSFSGFNPQIQAAVNQSVKSELVESRICKPVYKQKKNSKKYIKQLLTSPLLVARSFNDWGLRSHNNVAKIKFRTYRNRILLNSITSIKILFKIPPSSSEDDIPSLYLG